MSFFSGFPFGGFGGGQQEQDDEEIDTTKFYTVLGVQKTASQTQIKKAYNELVKKNHPDKKGGNVEKFQEIKEAFDTLGDPNKRAMYDKYGKKLQESGGRDDLMNMFFNGERSGKKEIPKVKPTKKALDITLEDIYNGKMVKIMHNRTRCCAECNGKGGKNIEKCTTCKGKGRVVQMFQMGPGMYQQVQKACDKCDGEGELIGEGGKCKKCHGKKIIEQEKEIEVAIQKGTPNNYPITLAGQGNQIPDTMTGDLIFITQEQKHDIFTRKGADLYMKKNITLLESIAGFEMKIKHLDESEYTIYSGKGEVVGDQDKKTVRGLGMPFFKDPMSHGHLIIEFHVQMPKRAELTKQQLQGLKSILPGKVNPRPEDDNYDMLIDFDLEGVNTNEQGGRKPPEEQEQQYEQGGTTCQGQ